MGKFFSLSLPPLSASPPLFLPLSFARCAPLLPFSPPVCPLASVSPLSPPLVSPGQFQEATLVVTVVALNPACPAWRAPCCWWTSSSTCRLSPPLDAVTWMIEWRSINSNQTLSSQLASCLPPPPPHCHLHSASFLSSITPPAFSSTHICLHRSPSLYPSLFVVLVLVRCDRCTNIMNHLTCQSGKNIDVC